ncbi:MAG: BamA/TamA family outer membrane protein [Ignavibacteriaceae bacterium]|nr:BamA/TamA family outer membrane protein [Ignavibacteriaceae bacterium]
MKRAYTLLFVFLICGKIIWAQSLPKYELTDIKFEGNKEFSSSELKQNIKSKETPFWGWKLLNSIYSKWGNEAVYFDSSLIPTDLNYLKAFYDDNGFFKSQFTYHYTFDTSAKGVTLLYKVTEGEPSRYGTIKIQGFKNAPDLISKQVFEKLQVDSSDRYNAEKLGANIHATATFLLMNGYMNALYDSTIIYKDTINNRANLEIRFSPGRRYKISSIDVDTKGEGKDYVSKDLIKDLIAIKPEEYYDIDKIKNSQTRLSKTGLFTSLKLEGGKADSSRKYVPLEFEGTIGNMNELSPEIVADNEQNSFNLGLGGVYIRKNFLGYARKLTVNGKFGLTDILHLNFANIFRASANRDSTYQGYYELTTLIEQPYIFNQPITGSLEFYIKTRTQLRTNIVTYGSRVGFDFELPDYTFVNQLRTYYNIELYDLLSNKIQNANLNFKFNSISSILGAEIASAKANDLFFPTNGYNLSFIIEGGIANTMNNVNGSDSVISLYAQIPKSKLNTNEVAYFYKLQESFSKFIQIAHDNTSVIGIKFKTGYIQTVKGNQELIPPNKTFVGGGSNSVRGWRARTLVPVDTVSYYGIIIPENVRGGTFLVEGSVEYRKKLLQTIGVALFTDYGNTWNGYDEFRINQLALAIGFGIRYYSSIAPFRLDFGFRLYDPADDKWIFKSTPFRTIEINFGIGEAF